jgi:hypothetical protein
MKKSIGLAAAILLSAASVQSVTLPYVGVLSFGLATLPGAAAGGAGVYVGPTHVSTVALSASQFGPVQVSLPVTSSGTIQWVRISNLVNLAGTLTGLSSGAPSPQALGLQGTAKVCLIFAPACGSAVNVPLTPSAATGLGIGGTQTIPGAVALTMYHAPFTVGQPVMTIHTANSTVTTPTLPGGLQTPFSSTLARAPGVLQLVTVTKVYTSLISAFPELPVFAILMLRNPVPEPGTFLLVGAGVVGLAIFGRSRGKKG